MYSAAEIRRMVRKPGSRSKVRWAQLPEKYRRMRARNAVLGKKGAQAPPSYRNAVIRDLRSAPGSRSLLPDKYLTKKQLKNRQTNRYLNNPVFAGADMTGRGLETQIKRQLRLQFGPQEQADARALAETQATRLRNKGWWNQYQAAVQNSQAAFNQYAQQQQAPQISTSAPVVNGQVASPTAPAASGVQAALGSVAAGRVNSNQMASAAALASGVNTAGQRVGEQRALLDQAVMGAIRQRKQTAERKALSAQDLRAKFLSDAQQRFMERYALMGKDKQFMQNLQLQQARLDAEKQKPNKWGYLPAEWAKLSPKERQRIILSQRPKKSGGSKTGGSKTGGRNKNGGGTGGGTGGDKPLTTNQVNNLFRDIGRVQGFLSENGNTRLWRDRAQKKYGYLPVLIANSLLVNRGGISSRDLKALLSYGVPRKRIRWKVVKK